MSFASSGFLVFLALFASVWPWVRYSRQWRWWGLTAFSLFFYGNWDWRFVFLLIGTGLVDYWAALALVRPQAPRKLILALSIGANLGILGLFKYAGFFSRGSHTLFGWPEGESVAWFSSIILPVGISFYTFQSMSYTIDVYRNQLRPTRNVLHFFAYLSMFPQLVAGPIIRAAELLPQLEGPGEFSAANRWRGLERITLGFFKKLVIADNIAPLVNDIFGSVDPTGTGGVIWWLAALGFAVQIYCDFSGYSDIASGIALWMGYRFPENFTRPYSALGFREFWMRWHISLSTWFRDYVYIPLGGGQGGAVRRHTNLWLTLLASGLWHGANWTFLVWGAVHASLLSVERITNWPARLAQLPGGRFLGIGLTFAAGLIAWVIFRAESLSQAGLIVKQMLGFPLSGWAEAAARLHAGHLLALTAFLMLGLHAALQVRRSWMSWWGRPGLRLALVVAGLMVSVFFRGTGHEFIYFQF